MGMDRFYMIKGKRVKKRIKTSNVKMLSISPMERERKNHYNIIQKD